MDNNSCQHKIISTNSQDAFIHCSTSWFPEVIKLHCSRIQNRCKLILNSLLYTVILVLRQLKNSNELLEHYHICILLFLPNTFRSLINTHFSIHCRRDWEWVIDCSPILVETKSVNKYMQCNHHACKTSVNISGLYRCTAQITDILWNIPVQYIEVSILCVACCSRNVDRAQKQIKAWPSSSFKTFKLKLEQLIA